MLVWQLLVSDTDLKLLSLYRDPPPWCDLVLDSTDRKLVMSG